MRAMHWEKKGGGRVEKWGREKESERDKTERLERWRGGESDGRTER